MAAGGILSKWPASVSEPENADRNGWRPFEISNREWNRMLATRLQLFSPRPGAIAGPEVTRSLVD